MIRTLLALFLFANVAWAACTKINMPTDYAVVTNGTRANLKANFSEVQTRVNPCMDSVDEVRGRLSGYSTSLGITSLENLRLRIDGDGSTTGIFLVETSNGDSLFRVKEDSTAKFFGNLEVTGTSSTTGIMSFPSLTASLPLALNASKQVINGAVTGTGTTQVLSISPSITGTLAAASGTYSGTLGVTGAVSLASSLTFAAGQDILIADNSGASLTITQTGNPYLRFVTTDGSEKITLSKLAELSAGINISGNGTSAAATIYRTASDGLLMRGVTGSTLDLVLESASGSDILQNPTGTTSVTFPGTAVTISSLAGTGTRVTTSTSTGVQGNATTIAGANTWSDVQTLTAAPILSAATASRLYATNGSKAGTSNAALTINGFSYPDGAGSLASTSAATNGQLLIGSTSAAPVAATLTGTANEITVTNGAGSITLDIPNSPVFTTPNIGAATATSVAASGAVSGVSLATTGGETFTYGDTSFTITVSTGMSTTPTGTAYGTRIGNVVTLRLPYITGTSNAATFVLSGIPPTWTPTAVQPVAYAGATDNGIPIWSGFAYVFTNNTIVLGTAAGGTAGWTSSGTKATGIASITAAPTITYTLQ